MRITTCLLLVCGIAAAQESQPPAAPKLAPAEFEVPASAFKGVQREGITLSWSPEVGQARGYRAQTDMQLVQEYGHHDHEGEGAEPVQVDTTQAYGMEIVAVEAEHVLVRCTSRELVVELSAAGMVMTTNTRDGTRSGNPGLDLFAELVGEPFTLKVSRTGRVLGIENMAELYTRLEAKSPFGDELDVKSVIQGERLALELQPMFLEFGPAELTPGQRWAVSRTLQTGAEPFVGTQTYVYLGVTDYHGEKCAKLIGRFELKPLENPKPGPNDVAAVSATGDPYAIYVSTKTGAVVGAEEQQVSVSMQQNLGGEAGSLGMSSKTTLDPLSAEELGAKVEKPDWNKKPPQGPR